MSMSMSAWIYACVFLLVCLPRLTNLPVCLSDLSDMLNVDVVYLCIPSLALHPPTPPNHTYFLLYLPYHLLSSPILSSSYRFAPDQPTVADVEGRVSNFIDVSDFEPYIGDDTFFYKSKERKIPNEE
jgi:hypothetical protein